MGLATPTSYDFLAALTIEGQFVPQRTDLHNAILPPTQPQGCCSSKLTPQRTNTPSSLSHCPHPQKLGAIDIGRRPQPSTALDVWRTAKPNHVAVCVFPSSVQPLLRSHSAPQRRRNPAAAISSDSTPRSNPRPMTTSNTRRKLASMIVCHPYARPRPLSPMPSVRQSTVPPPTQASSISGVTRHLAGRLFIRSALQV